jgi:hypothetical protein
MKTFRGVVLTYRAFRAETELLLYSENIFSCCKESDWYTWIRLLDAKKLDAIRTMLIDGEDSSAMGWFAFKWEWRHPWVRLSCEEVRSRYKFEEVTDGEKSWFRVSWK